jgi:hypothetical protein
MTRIFDPDKLHYVPMEEALQRIQSGWMAQYRVKGLTGTLIQYGTGGVHSHTAMLRKNCDGTVDVMQMILSGGDISTLEHEAEKHEGRIDVFSTREDLWPFIRGDRAVDYMRRIVDNRYGYLGVWRLLFRKVPLLWRLYPLTHDDLAESHSAPFCSHAYCTAWRRGGFFDPVPRRPDWMVTPNDLTSSLFFNYEFSL